jgi:hypothetical protein
MKTGTIAAIAGIIVIVSMALGYAIRIAFEKPAQPKTTIVFEKDIKAAQQVDSLCRVDSVKNITIDSLSRLLIKTHIVHENIVAHVDSMPVPDVFSKLSDYYK